MSAPAAQNYTGFKLGEKKKYKESEGDFEANSTRLRALLGDSATTTIDWGTFEPKLTNESARNWAGKHLMATWYASIVKDLEKLAATFGNATLQKNVQSLHIVADDSKTSDRFVPSLSGGKLTVAVNVERIEYDGVDGKLAEWLSKNMVADEASTVVGGISLKGFGLEQANKIKQSIPAFEQAQASIQSSLGSGVKLTADAPSFEKMPEGDKMWFGANVLDKYANGVAKDIAELAKDSDYKEAMVDSIQTVHLTADTTGKVDGRVRVELAANKTLLLSLDPAKVCYGYDDGTVLKFLKKAY